MNCCNTQIVVEPRALSTFIGLERMECIRMWTKKQQCSSWMATGPQLFSLFGQSKGLTASPSSFFRAPHPWNCPSFCSANQPGGGRGMGEENTQASFLSDWQTHTHIQLSHGFLAPHSAPPCHPLHTTPWSLTVLSVRYDMTDYKQHTTSDSY